ncbi:MAG TPA: DUF779 domain-containing protein [Ilumatobacteraceae bacterium]|nr:DUF779 domain-containing protein [Ilumatobacteraceae bacterium]
MSPPVERVAITHAAAQMLASLVEQHGPVLFHQSGGCCDGSSPMCFPRGEFRIGDSDVYLGAIEFAEGVEPAPFYMGAAQFEYWAHTHLTVDVVPGRGAGFSLEAPEGVRFIIRSRLFTDDESAELARHGPPPTGAYFSTVQ